MSPAGVLRLALEELLRALALALLTGSLIASIAGEDAIDVAIFWAGMSFLASWPIFLLIRNFTRQKDVSPEMGIRRLWEETVLTAAMRVVGLFGLLFLFVLPVIVELEVDIEHAFRVSVAAIFLYFGLSISLRVRRSDQPTARESWSVGRESIFFGLIAMLVVGYSLFFFLRGSFSLGETFAAVGLGTAVSYLLYRGLKSQN